jgi:hypothetical protein
LSRIIWGRTPETKDSSIPVTPKSGSWAAALKIRVRSRRFWRAVKPFFGAFSFWWADFVGGGVAGFFEGAPHVPGGDGAVRAPAFAEGEEFFGAGHVFFVVGDGPAFFYAEVVDGEDVGAAETEDQEHFDGPGANAADRNETFD